MALAASATSTSWTLQGPLTCIRRRGFVSGARSATSRGIWGTALLKFPASRSWGTVRRIQTRPGRRFTRRVDGDHGSDSGSSDGDRRTMDPADLLDACLAGTLWQSDCGRIPSQSLAQFLRTASIVRAYARAGGTPDLAGFESGLHVAQTRWGDPFSDTETSWRLIKALCPMTVPGPALEPMPCGVAELGLGPVELNTGGSAGAGKAVN